MRKHTSNNPQIEEDYDRNVHSGLTNNTSAWVIHQPSTKRNIMPRTHERSLAKTTPSTLNDHTQHEVPIRHTMHIQHTSAAHASTISEAHCTERKRCIHGSGLQEFSRATDIWDTAKQTFMMDDTRIFLPAYFFTRNTAKALHFRLSGIFFGGPWAYVEYIIRTDRCIWENVCN